MALHFLADAALDDLLTAWRHYDDARASGQDAVEDLGRARILLDQARARMHRIRSVLYPNTSEQEAVLATVLCATLDEVVHLNASHRELGKSGHLRCVCGELVAFGATAAEGVLQ